MARMFIFSDSFALDNVIGAVFLGGFPFEMMDCPSNQDSQGVSQGLTIHLLGTYILDDRFLILNSEPWNAAFLWQRLGGPSQLAANG